MMLSPLMLAPPRLLHRNEPRKGIATMTAAFRPFFCASSCIGMSPARGLQHECSVTRDELDRVCCIGMSPVRGLQPIRYFQDGRIERFGCIGMSPVRGLQLGVWKKTALIPTYVASE